jgi:excinuclease ABC subunit B
MPGSACCGTLPLMDRFRLVAKYDPRGDQPEAIEQLVRGIETGERHQTLLGVTGSGKTFTMANVIERVNRPTLIFSHNKTLAAQLYGEFRSFFPDNAVGYFVSYYDYYQPEAYVPSTDTYIEKDASINDDIDRLRLHATSILLSRRDVIIVASVSCIYGLGAPEDFLGQTLSITVGEELPREQILSKLVAIQYSRNDVDFSRGNFRVRGDVVEVFPSHEEEGLRIELFGDTVERLSAIDPTTGHVKRRMEKISVFPASHFATPGHRLKLAIDGIQSELDERLRELTADGKLLEAQRLKMRTRYDIEMLREMGFCNGIENYSRHLAGRAPGSRPTCLLDYFPKDYITFVDESHVTIPQIGGMHEGDRSRKRTLVDFGFRLPSALDNRPLRFDEWREVAGQVVYVSATPAKYELDLSGGVFVEQVIRPTGLVDPEIQVRPIEGQIDDLMEEIRKRTADGERILVTTLTKRMAEDLTDYLTEAGVRVRYIHSDVGAIERMEILRGLRLGKFDVLVGINLLREGLDLPEVSLVAILDADKEGFLRSERSLIQTAGRAARNVRGLVILYADAVTPSMSGALRETDRRRTKQMAYNTEHGITPKTIEKTIDEILMQTSVADAMREAEAPVEVDPNSMTREQIVELLTREMKAAADRLEYERAASLRDRILEMEGLV